MKKILCLILLFISELALAEYRVYQYYVRPKRPLFPNAKAYLITSSLDPVAYKSYHGGEESLVVDLLRTWICPGYTGKNKDYCPSPYAKLETTKATAENAGPGQIQ